jgi:hypothetical protein
MHQLVKQYSLGVTALSFSLSLASSPVLAGYDGALSGTEVEALFKGNTLQGKHSVKGFQVELFINPDGAAIEKRSSNIYPGKWNIDNEGRFCWVLDKYGELWCRWVVKTGGNEYIKVKDDGKEVRRFKVTPGKAF